MGAKRTPIESTRPVVLLAWRYEGNSLVSWAHASPGDGCRLADTPRHRIGAARGAATGMLLGAGLWSAILLLAGGIKS